MTLRNDKKDVFTTIGAFTSLNNEIELPEGNNTFLSINENREPLPFLMDIIKSIVGDEGLKTLTGELFTSFLDEIEPTIKSELIKLLTDFNYNEGLPDCFKNIGSGISIPIKDFDFFEKFKTDPSSDIGKLLYGDNGVDDFDSKIYDAIVAEGTDITFENLRMNYDSLTETINFKSINDDLKIGEWFVSFINQLVLIKKDAFIASLINQIFGSLTTKQNKSFERIKNEKIIDRLLSKYIDESFKSDFSGESINISSDELNRIFDEAEDLSRGVVRYDLGCDVIFNELSDDDLENVITTLTTTTNPNEVVNVLEDIIINNSNIDDLEDDVVHLNRNTVFDSFLTRLINFLKNELIKVVTLSPQIAVLFAIRDAIKNNCTHNSITPEELLKNNQNIIRCQTRKISASLNGFIYEMAITFLKRLVKPVISKIIREKINQYIGILRSLAKL